MKTIYNALKLFLPAALVILLTAAGCESITNPDPVIVIDEEKTATIAGVAYADLDLSEPDLEYAPEGVNVKVVLNARDYISNPAAGVNYQNLTYTTTIGHSGSFTIEVPALDTPVQASIYMDQFQAEQRQTADSVATKVFAPAQVPYTIQVTSDFTTHTEVIFNAN